MRIINKNLQELRDQIDVIDKEIVFLICDRLEVAFKIAKLKKRGHLSVTDKSRERQVVEQVIRHARFKKMDSLFVTKLFRIIIHESRRLQTGVINEK